MWSITIRHGDRGKEKPYIPEKYDTFVSAQQRILKDFPNIRIVSTSEFHNGSDVLKIIYEDTKR